MARRADWISRGIWRVRNLGCVVDFLSKMKMYERVEVVRYVRVPNSLYS